MNSKISPALLEKALADERLLFFYQPIISLSTGKICGAESLIRWKQPDGSIISADLFIPLAEKTGFITEITKVMLPKVVSDLAALNLVDDSLFVTFNVSPKDFDNGSFLKVLSQCTSGKLAKLENLYIEMALVHKSRNKQNPWVWEQELCNQIAFRHAQMSHFVKRSGTDPHLSHLCLQ